MVTSSKGSGFRVPGPMCEGSTDHQRIPLTKGSNAGFDVSFDVRLNKRLNKQCSLWWFETPGCSLRRHYKATTTTTTTTTIRQHHHHRLLYRYRRHHRQYTKFCYHDTPHTSSQGELWRVYCDAWKKISVCSYYSKAINPLVVVPGVVWTGEMLKIMTEVHICTTCTGTYNEIENTYRKTSNISHTKSPNLEVSRLVLQLSLPNQLRPCVESRMKM